MKIITLSILALFVLCAGASCVPGDTAGLIESLLKNTDSGQMTFVTSDGEEVIVTLQKTGRTISDNATTVNTLTKTVKPVTATIKPSTSKSALTATKPATTASLSNYLPVLNSIEDIFKTLGVWDKADELQKKGLGWAQIAAELGYDKDSMYAKVLELNKEKLYKAKELGLIDQATYEYKIKYYGELALKYITKIFTEPTKTPTASLSNYLPVLNSIDDVFKTLGQWEQASAKYAKGYRWSQIAADLGYDKDSMYAHLLEFNEEKLGQAFELGLIDKATLEYKIKLYGDQGLKWIEKIFAS
jgi:hypothetical protein